MRDISSSLLMFYFLMSSQPFRYLIVAVMVLSFPSSISRPSLVVGSGSLPLAALRIAHDF